MTGEPQLTLIGNLTADPELRFTPKGDAVANFSIASTPRSYDAQSREWVDGEPLFLRGSAWRELAENIAESLRKGDRVVCVGKLKARSYETKEGDRRTVQEIEVEEIGPSLRFAQAVPQKANRQQQRPPQGQQQRPQQGQGQGRGQYGQRQGGRQYDPWGEQAQGGNQQHWDQPNDQEPPF